MMINELNSDQYKYSITIYNKQFEILLSKIIDCYNMMLIDGVKLQNDENAIRDVLLLNYLKENSIRKLLKLTDFLFHREVPEDKSNGRTDIQISTANTFENIDAYYILECKRIDSHNPDGISGLNFKYIENGILRYVTKKYSLYARVNGMLGFVVDQMNIDRNVEYINQLIDLHSQNSNTKKTIKKIKVIDNFEFQYDSVHYDDDKIEFRLYHLMLDFSNNIKKE